jgi:preprotein translocase subunit SecA
LEAKEGLPVSPPTGTVASLSFQRFFRQVPRLAGVTGTARDAAAEFWRLYRLPVLAVPTHRPVVRRVLPLQGFPNEAAKWSYVTGAVRRWQLEGQPVLIGTRTVAASEALAARLQEAGIAFALLNGVRNENEAKIIAAAGQAGQVTIATNMAGRGTDIVPTEAALAAGGLRVIATERHRSTRVDRQLHGRSGRQGQPGVVEPLGCWDDEIIRHQLPAWWHRFGSRRLGAGRWLRLSLAFAQWRAGRHDAARRLAVLRQDQWLDENLSLGAAKPPPVRAPTPVAARAR